MAETLRPCPFCGGTAGVDKTNYYFEDSGELAMSSFVVSCRACGMKTAQHRTEDGAVMAWNRRKERTCRMEAFLLGEFFTGHRLTTSTDMSDDEMGALLEKLREDTIIRCSACHFSVPDGANVSYEQSDDGAWSASGCEPRANYCPHCGARVVKEEA